MEKPALTLVKPHTMRDTCQQQKKRSAQGLVRTQCQGKFLTAKLSGHIPHASDSAIPPLLIVNQHLIHIRVIFKQRARLGSHQHREVAGRKPLLYGGDERRGEHHISEKAGLCQQNPFHPPILTFPRKGGRDGNAHLIITHFYSPLL